MLKNRFLSVFTLAFAAGIAMPFLLGTEKEAVSFLACACLAALLVFLFVWAHFRMKDAKRILLYPLLFAVGMLCGAGWLFVRSLPYASYEAYVGTEDTVEGIVTESGSSAESGYIELKIERSKKALPKGTRVRLYYEDERLIRIGDRVGAELTYQRLSYDSQRAGRIALTAQGVVTTAEKSGGIVSFVRYEILNACYALYQPYGVAGTAQALLVRERTLLCEDVSEAYRNAGLSHLLAISGMHLTILINVFRKLLSVLKVRKQVREIISLLLIVFYCILAGFSPSVVRAAIMLSAVVIGEITLSDSDGTTMLFVALLALLLANPYALLSLGLQLSFLSCLGIILLEPYVTALQQKISGRRKVRYYRLRKILASIAGSFLMSCSAVVFTFPVTVFNFGTVAYLSPLMNLVFIPLFTPVLALTLLSAAVYPFIPLVSKLLAVLPGQILRHTEDFLVSLYEREIGSIETDSAWMVLPAVCAAAAILCMLLFMKHGIRLYLSFSVAFALFLTTVVIALPKEAVFTCLYVSPDEGYVFSAKGEQGTFLDLGGEAASFSLPESEKELAIGVYIATDADEYTLARLELALESGEIETVYLPLVSENGIKNDLSSLKALANEKNCDIIEYYYAVETDALYFDARQGIAETPFDIAVLLYGKETAPAFAHLVLMPSYTGDLQTTVSESLYLPLSYTPVFTSDAVHFYRNVFWFQNGEVVNP